MGITVQQELLRIERVLGESNRGFTIEGRLGLPSGAPPLDRIQFCGARVREAKAQASAGRVQIEGLVEIELNYSTPVGDAGEMEHPDHLVTWSKENGGALAFAQELPLAGVTAGDTVEAGAYAAAANAEILDSGTIRCQVSLELTASATATEEVRVATDVAMTPIDRLEVAKEVLHLESPTGRAESEVTINTVLALPEVKPDLVRVLARHAHLTEITAEVVRGRVAIGGRIGINMVYVSRLDDGGQGIEINEWGAEGRTPIGFEAFLDLPGLGPDAIVTPDGRLGRLSLEAIGPREVRLDATIAIDAVATRSRQVTLVTELIPGAEEVVDLQRAQLNLIHLAGRATQELTVESTLELPPGKPGAESLLQARVRPALITAQAAEGKCLIDGWLDVSLLYQAEPMGDARPVIARADWARHHGTGVPLAEVIELPEAGPGLDASLSWRLGRVSMEQIAPRSLRLVVTLQIAVRLTEQRSVSSVTDAAVVPTGPIAGRPSMLFYAVQPEDSLWGIARRYETTVEALVRINKIADPGTLATGRKILIPRSPVAI